MPDVPLEIRIARMFSSCQVRFDGDFFGWRVGRGREGELRTTRGPSTRLGMTVGGGCGREAGVRGNERSPFDFAQGRLSAALRSGRDDERRSRGLDEVATQEIA
jgi:hypothetical protein